MIMFCLFAERTIVVSEYVGRPLSERAPMDMAITLRIVYQIASGLAHVHQHDIVVQNLEPKNVLLDELNNVKLFNYGMFYQTNGGELVAFPIGNVRYLAPERLLGSKDNIKSDVWSLGIIFTELVFQEQLYPSLNVAQVYSKTTP